ncbi:MAG: rhodanese-like domain-containing protein [Bacteroidota bacterium]|nr:rhodanese-like domain-containing protein [Bacteroidota bacterium]
MSIFQQLFGGNATADLKELVATGAFLVDVRTPGEFAEDPVKGAVNIPLDALPYQLSAFEGRKNIIVFCRSGNRSGQAKAILERNGFANVVNGGTASYVRQFV